MLGNRNTDLTGEAILRILFAGEINDLGHPYNFACHIVWDNRDGQPVSVLPLARWSKSAPSTDRDSLLVSDDLLRVHIPGFALCTFADQKSQLRCTLILFSLVTSFTRQALSQALKAFTKL